ncbi:MAG: hypothetical protein ABWJ42_06415 [Sulfolobales archaeon]
MIALIYSLVSFIYYYRMPWYNSYISDEIWYVDSARNLLYLFGYHPRETPPYTATLFLRPETDIETFISLLRENYTCLSVITTLSNIKAVYISSTNLTCVLQLINVSSVKYLRLGYLYGDASSIDTYYNLEHPPLGKYFIIFSMITLGDNPFSWRLPSLALGFLKVFLAGLFVYRVTRDPLFSVLGSLALLMDPINIYMDGIAMLEAYVSFFTLLSVILIALEYYEVGGVFIGLAGASKMSGFFVSLPALLLSLPRGLKKSIVSSIVIPLLIFILVNIPIIALFGYQQWWRDSIVGALSWHLSTKTKPGEGPPISAPWDWFLGLNPFYVTVNPDTPIRGNILIYLGVIVMSIALSPFVIRHRVISSLIVLTYGTWLGYVIVWFAGNKSEYSFYMAQISPLFDILFVLLLYIVYSESENIKIFYERLFRRIDLIRLIK